MSYSTTVLADGAVAYWRLGETSGTNANDEHPSNNNDGTYNGGFTLAQTGALLDSDKAVALNGSSGYISVPDAAALDLGDVFSIEFWVKRGSTGSVQTILDKGANAYQVTFGSNDALVLSKSGNPTPIGGASTTITDTATFHHVVITKNGATFATYIDGVDRTVLVGNQTLSDTSTALSIGRNTAGAGYLDGTLDELALYNVALTAAQVREHYRQGVLAGYPYSGGYPAIISAESGLVSYWRLGAASGSYPDAKGPNFGTGNGTITRSEPGALVGNADKSAKLDGSTGFITAADDNSLDLGDVLTLEMWIKRTSTQGAIQTLIFKGTDAYQLFLDAGNRLALKKVGIGTNIARVAAGDALTDTASWHHIVATKNGGTNTAKLYIDGVDKTVLATDQALANNALSLGIGSTLAVTTLFSGWVDEVAIYNVALTPAQVLQHYQVGRSLLGQASETDTAQALDKDKKASLGIASETDAAQALVHTKPIHKTATPATETDAAQALPYVKPIQKAVTPAAETDAAQALDADKKVTLGPASETDIAQTLSQSGLELAPALETDAAQALSYAKPINKTLTSASESDQAQALAYAKQASVTATAEADSAQSFDSDKALSLGPVSEADSALPLSQAGTEAITWADETDAAQPLGYVKPIQTTLTPATESDEAQALSTSGAIYVSITPASETDEAQPLGIQSGTLVPPGGWIFGRRIQVKRPQHVSITPATEFDIAIPLTVTKTPSRIQIEDDELLLLV